MPWQQQGGGGPWGGSSGGGAQPPDFNDMLRKGQDRLRRMMPGGMGTMKGILLLVVGIVFLWLMSGIYRVQPGEQGVEMLFGKFIKQTGAGLHWWLPSPIGGVHTPNVQRTNTISVGFRTVGGAGHAATLRDVPEESLMLTGDQNIIDIDYMVQWRIKSARDFLFNIRDPEATVKLASESAIREVVGQTTLEDTLARNRTAVEEKTKALLQHILDQYGAGVFIAEVKMQKVDPPQTVIDAFNDVQRAKQDRERQQNEAQAYANDIIPKAKGQSQIIVQGATAYREQLIKEAEGEAKRFLSVYEAYKTGKEVTLKRLYLERMQEVMRTSEKVIIGTGQGGPGVVPYLPLPEIRKRVRQPGTAGEAQQ